MAITTNKPTTGAISSALLMLAALLWLTISTPFVFSSRQAAAENLKKDKAEQQASPLSGTTEERHESGINTLSEYMHEHCIICSYGQPLKKFEKCHAAAVYISFHPELHSPPPNPAC